MESVAIPLAELAIGKMKSMINTYVDEQYQYQTTDVKAKLQQLNNSLTKIQAVVAAAQSSGIKEPSLLQWLSRLRDAIFDAEYVVDVFEYRRVEKEIESWSSPEETEVVDKGRINQKVFDLLKLPSCSCFKFQNEATKFAKRLIFADEELNDLLEVVNKFDSLVAEMHDFTSLLQLHQTNKYLAKQQAVTATDRGQEMRETTSVPNERVLFGRNEVEEQLRHLLLQSSGESETTFSVISIVGVGGVGKSSLAQSIFHRQEVKDHFNIKAWVSVSTNFKIKDLMLGIIEAAGIDKPTDFYNLIRLESIAAVLSKGLQSKKFLIVLDDVWEDMQDQWEEISKALQNGDQGSKIVVTSRSHKVAEDMGVEAEKQIKLNPLNSEYFWSLFKKCAFGNKTPESYPKFMKIGEQIANQLGGLPLAAKTVGVALYKNFNIEHWKGILTSKVWKEEENKIMSALRLSYDHLPVHLKKCFVYCSLFPKDFRYDKRNLIDIWIALDCIKSTDVKDKRLVDIQREYIDELVGRCFLEKITMDHNTRYIIHDLLHDLAEANAGKEVHRIENDESLSKPIPHNARHLYLKSNSDSSLNKVLLKFAPKQLRSLVYFADGVKSELQMSKEMVEKLKGLRLLLFYFPRNVSLKIPESLGDLLHIRCINFIVHDLVLPESFARLYLLQILRWRNGRTRVKLLSHIDKLINLRHVDNTIKAYDYDPDILTAYLGRLKSLEVLPNGQYKIDGKEGKNIGQLGELDKISGALDLHVCVKLSEEEIRKANFNRKKYLTKLSIIDEKGDIDDKAIEAFQPHENLEMLKIHGCRDIIKAPTWLLMLSSLEFLELKELPSVQAIPPNLGHLLLLQQLKLYKLPLVRHIDVLSDGGDNPSVLFPSLISVTMFDMENLEGWSLPFLDSCNKTYFPKLSHVVIKNCPKFMMIGESPNRSIPFPSPWLNYSINLDCEPYHPYFSFDKYEKTETRLMYLYFDKIPFLIEYHHPHPTMLSSIASLTIRSYPQLECLPTSLQACSSLKTLNIQNCQRLQSLGPDVLPISINSLFILQCENLKSLSTSLQTLPSLETFDIKFCGQLELVEPDIDTHHLPSSIKRLAINDSCNKMKCLPESFRTLSSLETLQLCGCNGLESLGSNINSHHYFPPSIKKLIIKGCRNLKFLYATSLETLSSLEVLVIGNCSNLESLVNNVDDHHAHLPASVNKIVLGSCKKLKIPLASFQMLSSLETLIMENCEELKDMLISQQHRPNDHQVRALFANVKEFHLDEPLLYSMESIY